MQPQPGPSAPRPKTETLRQNLHNCRSITAWSLSIMLLAEIAMAYLVLGYREIHQRTGVNPMHSSWVAHLASFIAFLAAVVCGMRHEILLRRLAGIPGSPLRDQWRQASRRSNKVAGIIVFLSPAVILGLFILGENRPAMSLLLPGYYEVARAFYRMAVIGSFVFIASWCLLRLLIVGVSTLWQKAGLQLRHRRNRLDHSRSAIVST